MEPTCPRCREPSEGLCAPCTGYVLRFDPYVLRPGIPGPSVDREVPRGVAFLSIDPKAPLRFVESGSREEDETFHKNFLRLLSPEGAPVVLTRGDRETMHRMLRSWVNRPPKSEEAKAFARTVYAEAASTPDLPEVLVKQFHSLATDGRYAAHPSVPPLARPVEMQAPDDRVEQTTPIPSDAAPRLEPKTPAPSPVTPLEPKPVEAPPPPAPSPPPPDEGSRILKAEVSRLAAERDLLTAWMEGQQAEVERRAATVRSQLDELRAREREIAEREQRIQAEELRRQEQTKELQKRPESASPDATQELYLALFSLEGVSREAASAIADTLGTVERLRAAPFEQIAGIPGVPPEEAALIRDAFSRGTPARRDLREKAEELLEEGRFEQALEVFDANVTEHPEDVEAWFNRSEVLTVLGRNDEASASLDHALKIDPKHKGSLRELSNLLFEKGDFGLAAAHLSDLLKLSPGEADHWLARAGELLTEGKATEATLIYNAILENDPKNLPASLALGDLLMAMEDVERADRTYSLVLQHHPDSPEALLKKGLLLNRRGRWGAAIQLFNRALSLRFDYQEAWAAKAQVLLAHGKPKEALEAFDRLISFDEEQPDAWLGKAHAYAALGQDSSAAEVADRVLSLDAENAEARELLTRLRGTEASAPPATPVEGIPRATIDTNILLEMADSFLDTGDGEAALQGYEEVLRVSPSEAKALFGKGRALHMLDRYQEALRYFSEAEKAAPHEEEYVRWRKRGEERVRKEVAE